MESSPRPLTNSGSAASMSSGVRSSRARALMISSLISLSSVCVSWVTACLRGEIVGQVFGQAARGQGLAAAAVHQGSDGHVVAHLDTEMRAARRDPPPGYALGEHGGVALDQ